MSRQSDTTSQREPYNDGVLLIVINPLQVTKTILRLDGHMSATTRVLFFGSYGL